jgi:DNA repair exonuclease SbcCD ATPase subunit
MEITLKNLSFSNMFSYGEANSLDIDKTKITQLTAPNGSGKSTIALIIQELLFSKNIKNIKKTDILNRYSKAKDWSGAIEFSVNSKLYKVVVKRTGASSKVSLYENGTDISEHKVPDTYKKISSILGMDFEVFSQLTYQSSTDLLDFIKATDTNRKKFLINLFGLEKYIAIGDALKVKLSSLEKDLAGKSGEIKTVNSFLEEADIKESKDIIDVPSVDESLRQNIARLRNELEDYQSQCKKIDKNNMLIDERDKLSFNIELAEPYLSQGFKEDYEQVKATIASLSSKISDSQKKIKGLDTSDSCYACGQHIDNSRTKLIKNSLESDIVSFQEELKEKNITYDSLTKEYNKYEKDLKNYNSNQKAIERFEQISQLVDSSIQTNYPDYTEIETSLSKFSKELKSQEQLKSDALDYNEKVKIHNTKIEALQEQKRQFLVRQQLLNDDIISLSSKIKNITILRKAFSTTGIVAFKLENLTKELEDTINRYLSELSDGKFQVIFRLEGEKLNIVVVNDGKETPVETVSGGEFSRIQTAILLSIRSLLSKIGGNYINLLFLDEVFSVLDDAGKEKLIEILLEEPLVNIFLVSHEYEHPLIPKIQIIKEQNVSRLDF